MTVEELREKIKYETIKIELVGGRILTIFDIEENDFFTEEKERGIFDNGSKYQPIYTTDARPWTHNGSWLAEDIVLSLINTSIKEIRLGRK